MSNLHEILNDEKSNLRDARRIEADRLADLRAAQTEANDDAAQLLEAEQRVGAAADKASFVDACTKRDRIKSATEFSRQFVATAAQRHREATADREAQELAVSNIANAIVDNEAEIAADRYLRAYQHIIDLYDDLTVIARRDLASPTVQTALDRKPATRDGGHETSMQIIRYGVPLGVRRDKRVAELLVDNTERRTEAA